MMFYILMAVSIGGGLAWAILLFWKDGRTYRQTRSYYDAPFFHFWIPLVGVAATFAILFIGSMFIPGETVVQREETVVLGEISDKAYIEAGYCEDGAECVSYMTKSGGYWSTVEQVYAEDASITEAPGEPTLHITETDVFNPSWFAPFGGPMTSSGSNYNKSYHYDFQVPTGTVAIK